MNLGTGVKDWKNWVSLAARLTLGITLIVAGALKLPNLDGSVHSTNAYEILPYELVKLVGYGMPFAEVILGILLVLGLFTRLSGFLGAGMMLAFIIAIASVWIRGISIDCGCFGNGGPIDKSVAIAKYPWEILRDIGLMACGVWLVVIKQRFLALDQWFFKPFDTPEEESVNEDDLR